MVMTFNTFLHRLPQRLLHFVHVVVLPVEIMPELPKTAVGKIFKPDLRKSAMTRVFNEALVNADATIESVVEDKKRGLVSKVAKGPNCDEAETAKIMGSFANKWDWAE